jgi:hypothetical protein
MTRLTWVLLYVNATLALSNGVLLFLNARNFRQIRKVRDATARATGLQRLRHDLVCGSAQGVVCPGCGGERFYQGPRGGMSVNVKCAGCGAAFNYSPVVGLSLIPCDDQLYGGTPRTLAQMYD